MKSISIFPFVISIEIIQEQGFTPIMWQIYQGEESGKWTMDFVLCDFRLLISII
ncbi:MAG: hypothetical protein HQ538_02245 [Parcubacteria group bacterium]|nr:hypothetical protein [Parcubacteria group bacterium]